MGAFHAAISIWVNAAADKQTDAFILAGFVQTQP
jgi:hypothetical protein